MGSSGPERHATLLREPWFRPCQHCCRDKEATPASGISASRMEILCVAGMPNNSVAISGFLVEAERHAIHVRHVGKLARVHESYGIGAEYSCALNCPSADARA